MERMERGTVAMAGPSDLPDTSSAADADLAGGLYVNLGKRAFDIALVLISLPVVVPVIAMCALLLWLEGGRPFYQQSRLGRGGRVFTIYKLRTMVRDAETCLETHLSSNPDLRLEWDETQKLNQDPRITPVGRMLRVTFLDELPQLWNVLRGDMSFVGPRPMMVQQLPIYGQATSYFSLRPGITGLWQVSDHDETSFRERAQFDDSYRGAISFGGDVKILMQTVRVVLQSSGC